MDANVALDGPLVGKTVTWEKSGRGRGSFAEGEVLAEVGSGTTNAEAMKIVEDEYQYEYVFRSSYNQFADDTERSERVIVAVEREDTKRARPVYDFYAPNRLEVVPA